MDNYPFPLGVCRGVFLSLAANSFRQETLNYFAKHHKNTEDSVLKPLKGIFLHLFLLNFSVNSAFIFHELQAFSF